MSNKFSTLGTQTQNVFNEATFGYIFLPLSDQSISPSVASYLFVHVVNLFIT